MQVIPKPVARAAWRGGASATPPLSPQVLEDADTFLGTYCLSLPNAQAAFRAARVTAAWLLGRGPAVEGQPAPRIVGVQLDARRVHHERVFDRLAALQDELSGTCGVPVSVRWYLDAGVLPPHAVQVDLVFMRSGGAAPPPPASPGELH